MHISEVTPQTVKCYAAVETDEDDTLLSDVLMPAAKAHIRSYTGLTDDELEKREELTVAYLALCAFLYDNRSMSITNDKQNSVIRSFLDAHCRGLVG